MTESMYSADAVAGRFRSEYEVDNGWNFDYDDNSVDENESNDIVDSDYEFNGREYDKDDYIYADGVELDAKDDDLDA